MEGMFEDDSQLRRCIENELLSESSISPEQALKVCKKSTDVLTWVTGAFFSAQYNLTSRISKNKFQKYSTWCLNYKMLHNSK